MKAAIFNGKGKIELGERPDPENSGADRRYSPRCTGVCVAPIFGTIVACLLMRYGPIGHEFIGIVEEVGAEVHTMKKNDFVIAPFTFCDGTCAHCRAGWPSNCMHGGSFGNHGIDGGQGEAVRAPSLMQRSSKFLALVIPKKQCAHCSRSQMLCVRGIMRL